jgi:hypothetical protein
VYARHHDHSQGHSCLETSGALRNRDPQICLLGGLAFHLLYHWDLTDEPFLNFSDHPAWYDIRLLKASTAGTDCTTPLAYNSQLDWVNKASKYASIISRKKTHIPRGGGVSLGALVKTRYCPDLPCRPLDP